MRFPKRAAPTGEGIGAANYLKVEENTSITCVPRGEVFEFYQKWPKGGVKEVFAEPVPGSGRRYKINVVLQEEGKFVAKVFEFGPRVYDQFADIAEDLKITETKIKISKRGSGKNTQWSVIPLGAADPKALKAIAEVALHELKVPGEAAPVAGSAAAYFGADERDDGDPDGMNF